MLKLYSVLGVNLMISFSGTVTIKILGGISFWSPVLFPKILSTIQNETNESARFRLLLIFPS